MAERGFEISRLPGFATVAVAAFVILYLPIVTLVVFSFNGSNSVATWGGFSLHWYVEAWDNDDVKAATMRSLIIGV
jgi:spermidine/putrescine transport system permease protein